MTLILLRYKAGDGVKVMRLSGGLKWAGVLKVFIVWV